MAHTPKNTDKAPAPIGPYSQAIVANGFVFCSGQIGLDPESDKIADSVEDQTHQVMKNLQAVLEEAGTDLEHVIKTTIFIKDMGNFAQINEIYASYFKKNKPARSTVEVSKLPKGTPLIEIDAIALVK
jgi:2-iminobutanoate/2-iminopropanoate deaminase